MSDTPATARLRVATLNVWALPFGISRDTLWRMQAIAAHLPLLDVDVMGFQEVWIPEARDALLAGARRGGFEHAWHPPGHPRGKSGLMFVARRPLHDVTFTPFAQAGLPQRIHHGDYWGGKGFVSARVETPAGPVTIVNTHLHAQYTPDPIDEYRGIRTAQAIELAAAVAANPGPVVALGDFNVRAGNPDHAVLEGLSRLEDAALALERPQDTVLAPHPYRGAGHAGGERIDYVFTRSGEAHGAVPRRIDRVFDGPLLIEGRERAYSDHAGLRVALEIVPGGGKPRPPALPEAVERARRLLAQGREEAARRRGIERALGLGSAALAVASIPTAGRLRASRREFLASVASGLGMAAIPGAVVAGLLSERAVPGEIAAYDAVERLLDALPVAS